MAANYDGASSSGTSVPTGTSGGWGDWLPLLIDAGSSLAGGWLSGQGGTASANANADAAQQVVDLQRGIYSDQRALARPGYMTGGAATNALANIYGIGPQNYEAAFSNGGMSSGGTNAQGLATNWGAGQPVAGHTGGGGPNALAAAAGSAAGSFFGPVGTAVGGALGGLIRRGGDNWQTKQTIAPEGYDYDKFWNDNPDLQVSKNGWPKADVQALFGGNRNAYLDWFQKQSPDRKIPLLAGYEVGANGVPVLSTAAPAAGGGATSGANALASPMKAFEATPYYDMAVKGFRGVDTPDVNAAYAKGGKVLSGAQSIALDERGKNRLGAAFGQYTAGLSDLAGLNSTASNQAGTAATNYGTSTGRAIVDGGTAKGNALASGYAGLTQGVSGALGALNTFGKTNWGWG